MENEFNALGSLKTPAPKRSKRFIYLIGFVLLVGVLIFGTTRFLGSRTAQPSPTPTPTPVESEFPTDTPTPPPTGGSPTPEESPTLTPKPTINPVDKASGLDRSELSVEVQNGSGEVGTASKGSEALKTFGYHVVSIGNADNFNYENVTIQIKEAKNSYLSLLKKDLAVAYTVGSASADLSASSSADAVVIIGK